MIQGTIIRVAGPVVDVQFTAGRLPALQEALTVTAEGTERTMEVTQHVNETTVRCIMLSASEGLGKGMPVEATGHGLTAPVGEGTLGRMFDPLGRPIDGKGPVDDLLGTADTLTARYLRGDESIPLPDARREAQGELLLHNVTTNNLRGIDCRIPLGVLTCVTGVSGSGKSSLVVDTLYKHLALNLGLRVDQPGAIGGLRYEKGGAPVERIVAIDQTPIGRTPRSNPATYTKIFDEIRNIFSMTPDARKRGYKPGRFSFNVRGGRCEACGGDGQLKIEMHFLPDIYVPCEVCKGKRYNRETLEVHYKGRSIADVLEMTVEEALEFFRDLPKLANKLETLRDVGLGYIKLGQSSTTLSGGEAQRVKLATELSKRATGRTIYILDEPTTGLHTDDVRKLLEVLQKLTDAGNTVLVIEHNLDVIKSADYLIDLGPEGGSGGGTLVACGTPEEVAACEASYTGRYLKKVL